MSSPRIFLVGPNRCATRSLHQWFTDCGIPSLHWEDEEGRKLAQVMMTDIAMARAPFADYPEVIAFSDITYLNREVMIDGTRFYRELHAAYPDAYFLLNSRNRDAWIASRAQHGNGNFLQRCSRVTGMGKKKVLSAWAEMFDRHMAEVTAYFAGNPRFLRFEIDADDPQRVVDWLAPHYLLSADLMGHLNRKSTTGQEV